jgi:hypothetical protein
MKEYLQVKDLFLQPNGYSVDQNLRHFITWEVAKPVLNLKLGTPWKLEAYHVNQRGSVTHAEYTMQRIWLYHYD